MAQVLCRSKSERQGTDVRDPDDIHGHVSDQQEVAICDQRVTCHEIYTAYRKSVHVILDEDLQSALQEPGR